MRGMVVLLRETHRLCRSTLNTGGLANKRSQRRPKQTVYNKVASQPSRHQMVKRSVERGGHMSSERRHDTRRDTR